MEGEGRGEGQTPGGGRETGKGNVLLEEAGWGVGGWAVLLEEVDQGKDPPTSSLAAGKDFCGD